MLTRPNIQRKQSIHCVYSALYFVWHSIECAPIPKEKSRSKIGAALYISGISACCISPIKGRFFPKPRDNSRMSIIALHKENGLTLRFQ